MFASSFGKNRTSDLPPFLAKGQISLANVSKPRFLQKATKAAEIRKAENPDKSKVLACLLASLAGFEPTAFRLGGERSILLSYRDLY